MEEKQELTVDGSPYAPISLRKFVDYLDKTGQGDKKLVVLINGTGNGMEIDDAPTVNVMIADRIMQTEYFVDSIYPQLERVPAYLYRYIQWFMFDEERHFSEMKYPTDQSYYDAIIGGLKDTDEYKQIDSFIKWGKSNTEATHCIALIQMIAGSLSAAKKQNSGIRLYIELPETGFHPKRERGLVMLLEKLREEYGPKQKENEK